MIRIGLGKTRVILMGLLSVLTWLVVSSDLSGQVIEGRLIDAHSEEPLDGAMVSLLDSSEQVVANALTNALGRFTLKAPTPGTYTLKADLIGFASAYSDPIPVEAGDTIVHRMETSFEPVSLQGFRSRATDGVQSDLLKEWLRLVSGTRPGRL